MNSVLLNRYDDGSQSVAWHADDEPIFGSQPTIASLSLGVPRIFKMRHNETKETLAFVLDHGSLLVMLGRTQEAWQHSVPKTSKPIGTRVNLTFRHAIGEADATWGVGSA